MSMPGPTELIIILIIVMLIFGTTKIKSIGGDLGGAIKNFRKGMSEAKKAETDLSNIGDELSSSTEEESPSLNDEAPLSSDEDNKQ